MINDSSYRVSETKIKSSNIKKISSELVVIKNKNMETFYKNKKDKLILICNIHNSEFEIEPKSHYYSNSGGCIECNNENKNKELLNEFINKYNNKFNFSTIQLKLTKKTVQI